MSDTLAELLLSTVQLVLSEHGENRGRATWDCHCGELATSREELRAHVAAVLWTRVCAALPPAAPSEEAERLARWCEGLTGEAATEAVSTAAMLKKPAWFASELDAAGHTTIARRIIEAKEVVVANYERIAALLRAPAFSARPECVEAALQGARYVGPRMLGMVQWEAFAVELAHPNGLWTAIYCKTEAQARAIPALLAALEARPTVVSAEAIESVLDQLGASVGKYANSQLAYILASRLASPTGGPDVHA